MQTWRRYPFFVFWILTTAGLGWLVLQGQHTFDSPALIPVLLALLACAIAFLWSLPSPVPDNPSDPTRTRRGLFFLATVATAAVLFAFPIWVGRPLLFALPIIGAVVLVFFRHEIARREALYALALALVAGITGLGAGWISFVPPGVWAVLQVLLVLTGFLGGWSMLRHSGLLQVGVGRSRFLTGGAIPALWGFVQGIVISIPWALGSVVLGASTKETWVQSWWQPVIAIQPGIAEEAWGRILLVPLVFLILRPIARTRTAFTAALVIVAYWFAYLHTSNDVFSTIVIGTWYVLPISYLCLYRDLETAMGFHFWVDFVKFAAAFLSNMGLWFR